MCNDFIGTKGDGTLRCTDTLYSDQENKVQWWMFNNFIGTKGDGSLRFVDTCNEVRTSLTMFLPKEFPSPVRNYRPNIHLTSMF